MIRVLMTVLAFAFVVQAQAAPQTYNVKVEGMTCDSCVRAVTGMLQQIPGADAKSVKVILKENRATVTVAEDRKEIANEIKAAIEKVGFKATTIIAAQPSTAKPAAAKAN